MVTHHGSGFKYSEAELQESLQPPRLLMTPGKEEPQRHHCRKKKKQLVTQPRRVPMRRALLYLYYSVFAYLQRANMMFAQNC